MTARDLREVDDDVPALELAPFEPAYELAGLAFRGFLRVRGEHHGIVITDAGDGDAGTTAQGFYFLNVEHFAECGRGGRFVPRRESSQSHRVAGDTVELHFGWTPTWQVETTLTYRTRRPDVVDADLRFRFARDYFGFEAFVASYFPLDTPSPWLRAGGKWLRASVQDEEQLFVARDDGAAWLVHDGRWRALELEGRTYRVAEERFDAALLVSGIAGRVCVLQMTRREDCSALSPNSFAPAHDLALIGRDVVAGEEVHLPLQLVCRRLDSFDEADAMHASLLAEHR